MLTRQEKLLQCIDVANQVGIEIGPLDKPLVTREMGNIHYIDHDTTEALKAKYAEFSNVDTSRIVDVNHVWGKQSLVELLQDEDPFDYALASHVIEHVPDFIGWLGEVRQVLKTGGILSLAIPDKRQCFDFHRNPTRVAEVVEAYLRQSKQPTSRQIFDHFSSAVSYEGNIAWDGQIDPTKFVSFHTPEEAWQITQDAVAKGDYCDVHCWVFTPRSFFQLLADLAKMGLLQFEVAQFHQTEGCEFLVSLRATDAPQPESIAQFVATLEDAAAKAATETEDAASAAMAQANADREFLQATIAAMESSKFWKVRSAWFKVKQKLGLPTQ